MANYLHSTQRRYWTFASVEELERLRAAARSRYAHKYPQRERIDPETEAKFRLACAYRLYQLARAEPVSLPRYVAATAVTLWKRFCLYNCFLEWDLNVLLPTLVYIAAKVDENYRSAAQVSQEHERQILAMELPLLSSIHFQAVCHHAYLIIRAEFPKFSDWSRVDEAVIRTDSALLMSPASFALVILGRELGGRHVLWENNEKERERCFHIFENAMQGTADLFKSSGAGLDAPRSPALEEAFQKLYEWYLRNRDPLLDKDSAESLHRQEQENRHLERQRRRHMRAMEEEERKRRTLLSSGVVDP
jgi:hypothetical protein